MAHTLILEDLRERVNTERTIRGIAQALTGSDSIELPSIDETVAQFEEWLFSEPEVMTEESRRRRDLERALGL